ncbi:hypothetical protein [Halalkalibacter hemicellulosilyticus]|uniref:Uncharacterized protein n=1 Tax=Halalkalibacter hemicellulosilyticusJCM 9152 TaxID=1236971 RepID=W4QEW5_9BACI|nr:hypothetical protein [Halalkalibacter hemicellulosilyticus]GAE30611.1 hypothetical protein JCM9152_2023 [Halalkalibacter hemicellulosilyticusJCM 9152]
MTDQLEKKLHQLKEQYDELPTHSNPRSIMDYIKKEEKKARRFYIPKQIQVAALVIVMLGIGYVLGMNQFAGDEELATTDMAGTFSGESNAEMSDLDNEIFMSMGEEDYAESESYLEDHNETRMGNESSVKTFYPEGIEEEKDFFLMDDDYFTAYYDVNYHYHQLNSLDMTRHQVYTDFIGDNEEPILFELTYFRQPYELDHLIDNYQNMLRQEGFSQFEDDESFFSNETSLSNQAAIVSEFKSVSEDIRTSVAIIEHNERYLFIRTSQFEEYAEVNEGLGYEIKFMIDQLSLH